MEEQYHTHIEQTTNRTEATETSTTTGAYGIPAVPIVRTSTPRPQPFGIIPSKTELPLAPSGVSAPFPVAAPTAPPVPEDPTNPTDLTHSTEMPARQEATLRSAPEAVSKALTSGFIWLFEYGLDMDPALLNRPARLDGLAFAYGPAVLHGYQLVFEGLDTPSGHVRASLTATPEQPEAEVWGVLYRVPRRLTQREEGQISILDQVHHAEIFVRLEIQVRDAYRHREIPCLTYVAAPSTRQQVAQLAPRERTPEPAYVQRLLHIARRQKLPGSYLRLLEKLVPTVETPLLTTPPEHTTDPLPAVLPVHGLRPQSLNPAEMFLPDTPMVGPWEVSYPIYVGRWMMSFALYVCLLLIATLMLAILQALGNWSEIFTANFAPLGTPWYVLLYGLLGGCLSCVLSLSRPRLTYPPTFVVLTWFVRPFLGAMLGALSYLILNSGIILLTTQPMQHFALCSLAGALAGLCEERLLLGKQNKPS